MSRLERRTWDVLFLVIGVVVALSVIGFTQKQHHKKIDDLNARIDSLHAVVDTTGTEP